MDQMGIATIEKLVTGGAFAVLFGFLLWYVLKTNGEREERYLNTIDKLADKLKIIGDVKEDTSSIKGDVQLIKAKVEVIK